MLRGRSRTKWLPRSDPGELTELVYIVMLSDRHFNSNDRDGRQGPPFRLIPKTTQTTYPGFSCFAKAVAATQRQPPKRQPWPSRRLRQVGLRPGDHRIGMSGESGNCWGAPLGEEERDYPGSRQNRNEQYETKQRPFLR